MSTKQMHRLRTHVRALSCARKLFRLLLLSIWSSGRRPLAWPRPRALPWPRKRVWPQMRMRPGRLLPNNDWLQFNSLP